MWLLNYLACLIKSHDFIDITWKGALYQYCLRCGKVATQNMAKETVVVRGR